MASAESAAVFRVQKTGDVSLRWARSQEASYHDQYGNAYISPEFVVNEEARKWAVYLTGLWPGRHTKSLYIVMRKERTVQHTTVRASKLGVIEEHRTVEEKVDKQVPDLYETLTLRDNDDQMWEGCVCEIRLDARKVVGWVVLQRFGRQS